MYVEVMVSRMPVNTLSDASTAFASNDLDAGLSDIYEEVLVDYLLYRAFSNDTNLIYAQLASAYRQRFYEALGAKMQSEKSFAPERGVSRAEPQG